MNTIRRLISENKAPYSGIVVDIVEYPAWPGLKWLTVYERNFENFSYQQQLEIMNWLRLIADLTVAAGIECSISLE